MFRAAALALFALAPFLPAQSRFDLHQVDWVMRPAPSADSVAMEMRLAPLHDRERLVLRLPRWRPGSYRFAEYQKQLSGLEVTDQDGRLRPITALDPRSWEVECAGAEALTVRYQLAVENEAPRGKPPAIHLHGPATFLYLEDALRLPHTLRVELPEGWKLASGHRPDPERPGLLRSPDYDVFVDCPLALGHFERHGFECQGKSFEVVLAGDLPPERSIDREELLESLRAVCEAGYAVVGEFPFERYTFLIFFNDILGYYGLEHLNSTTLFYNAGMARSGDLGELESLAAHEFFHLWNVKRIRPQQLGPFDYSQDVRTRDLWWLEGITSYYGDLMLVRAGLRSRDWMWQQHARVFQTQFNSSSYGKVSAERSSWMAWDGEGKVGISYYDQGQTLGLLLDIRIRAETRNRRSLDDVVRFLHRWIDYPGAGYQPGDLERAVRAVTGWDCRAFFDRHIRGVVDYPFAEVLPEAGLKVTDRRPGEAYLGFGADQQLRLSVPEDGQAYRAGLRSGDRILRLAGGPVGDLEDLRRILAGLEAGSVIEILVQRDGKELRFQHPIAERRSLRFRIEPDMGAPATAQAIREGILDGHPSGV